jgi:Ca2+-binding EF-hand superfamily protein
MKKLFLVVLVLSSSITLAQNRVAEFDRNGDSRVSFDELSSSCEFSRKLFDRADRNKDGTLSNAELSNARRYLLTSCRSELTV